MPSKRVWKNKKKTYQSKDTKERRFYKHQDDKPSSKLGVEEESNANVIPVSSPRPVLGGYEAPNFGQAFTRLPSRNASPWHDPFNSYLYPPTSLNFRPPFDSDGSHLARRSPGLTEYEGRSVEISKSMMASGHDQQQQRNQPPSHHRPQSQQNSHQQKVNENSNELSVNGDHQQRSQAVKERESDRESQQRRGNGALLGNRPVPSHIQVAKPYVFQQAIDGCLKDVGVAQAREDNIRLAGVQWIDNVRRALKLPVRTFDTAVIYYHKFRLVHSDGEYSFVDAAAAALFAACKIEDTLKKSRDILCAAHNLKVPRNEHLSPDDSTFEHHSRSIIGLERLMLEASSFDFRNRHPQTLMIKIAKFYNLGSPRTSVITKTAYATSLDLYRTFAPLKQSTATLAFSCLELAIRLHDQASSTDENIQDIINGRDYSRWGVTRAEVMETLLDLLELYTHYRSSTTVGPEIPLDTFLEVRIPLNEELNRANLPRFTEYLDTRRSGADPAGYAATVNGVSAATTAANGIGLGSATKTDSPTSPGSATAKVNGLRQKAGERGREGTVRFMLNPDRERQERLVVADYYPHLQPQGPAQPPPQTHTQAQLQAQLQPQPQSQQQQSQEQRQTHTPTQPQSHSHSHSQTPSQQQSHHGPLPTGRGSGPGPSYDRGRGAGYSQGRGHGFGHGQGNRPRSSDRGGMEGKPSRR